jgi:O-antigen ligase
VRNLPAVDLARGLLAGALVALLFSPSVTVGLEFLLYALMLGSAELRARLAGAARQPLGAMVLLFWVVVTLGLAYSAAPWRESIGMWLGWRKLFLVLIAVALFDDLVWKRRLALLLVAVALLSALASYVGILLDVSYYKYLPGIVIRNHATQGMVFAAAAFAAAVLARYEPLPRRRILLLFSAVLLVTNIAFVTPGRSGYVVLVVLSAALALAWFEGGRALSFKRLAAAAGLVALSLALLASSPVVRQRTALGVTEVQTYEQAGADVTSMGQRVIYARNTLQLIAERPLFGYGTGAFGEIYGRKVDGRPGMEGLKIHDPHNQYLNIAAEHGLLGLLVFLALLASAFRQRCSQPYRLLGLAVLAAWCATSLFSSHFSTFSEGRFIWFWLAVFLAQDTYRSA